MPNLSNDFEVRKETLRALGGNPDGLANIYEVDLEILKLIGSGGGGEGIPDAPIDGVQYARQNGEWTPVESGLDWNTIKQKLAEDGVESIKFIMGAEQVILTASEVKNLLNQTVLPDAPSDGKQYARQNGEWTTIQTQHTVEKYVTMTVDESNTEETIIHLYIEGSSLPNLNLQYRVNGGDWNEFIFGTTADIHVVAGDVVQWKGNNPNGVSDDSGHLRFDISNFVHLSGNIMSLIDGIGETKIIPNNSCFFYMFNSSQIKTVTEDFLPATTLKDSCYRSLFGYCNYLEKAPNLPATTLAPSCYSELFSGCYSLKQAPELNAKVLVNYCYSDIFAYCSSLNYVKCLATEGILNEDGTASLALQNWLNGVSSTGTFVKPDGVVYETGSNGIPSGWTVKEDDVIEAPNDGKQYSRKDGAWVESEPSKVKTTSNNTLQFWNGTQQEYDAIATKDANTLYVIS